MQRTIPILPLPSSSPGSTDFLWATGIEDTFICQPDKQTGRILDEYALTQHYEQWQTDLELIASLGVKTARYGIPWYRVEPEPGRFDWQWTDSVLTTLVEKHHIEPIVDLMHYGTPSWLDSSFLSEEYPERVAEYARAFAERYKGLCYWYTPLNEPRVNAWFAARLGWWPPYRRSWKDFAAVLAALSRGIVLTQLAIREVEPNAVFVHVDATDLYIPDEESLEEEARIRQELVFCALDLVQGKVHDKHPLVDWLQKQKISDATLDWFRSHSVTPDIIGYNMYPMFSEKHVRRNAKGVLEVKIRPCGVEAFTKLTRMYAERYGLPVMCTETASNGPVWKRVRWIEATVQQINLLRKEGVPLIGYTYWPLFSLVSWPYQRSSLPLERYLIDIGLWDLRPDANQPQTLVRISTTAVSAYREAVQSALQPLG